MSVCTVKEGHVLVSKCRESYVGICAVREGK